MELLDGKVVKLEILGELKEKLSNLEEKLSLVVIQVGNIEASNIYVRQKKNMAENIGLDFKHLKFDENISESELIDIIDKLNKDKDVTGIMIQLPLPKHLNTKKIQNEVLASKDVDGLTDYNAGLLVHNNPDALVACTASGIVDILDYYNIEVTGKNVVIIGRSDLVGKPLSLLLTNRNATVTLCHSKTNDLKLYTRNADILVVAIGVPNYIKSDDIKEDSVIIDVGINRVNDKIVGDVDFESVKDKVKYITPVPGGVGQLTVANLGKNTYKAYTLSKTK